MSEELSRSQLLKAQAISELRLKEKLSEKERDEAKGLVGLLRSNLQQAHLQLEKDKSRNSHSYTVFDGKLSHPNSSPNPTLTLILTLTTLGGHLFCFSVIALILTLTLTPCQPCR
jgi:hypothetical protein